MVTAGRRISDAKRPPLIPRWRSLSEPNAAPWAKGRGDAAEAMRSPTGGAGASVGQRGSPKTVRKAPMKRDRDSDSDSSTSTSPAKRRSIGATTVKEEAVAQEGSQGATAKKKAAAKKATAGKPPAKGGKEALKATAKKEKERVKAALGKLMTRRSWAKLMDELKDTWKVQRKAGALDYVWDNKGKKNAVAKLFFACCDDAVKLGLLSLERGKIIGSAVPFLEAVRGKCAVPKTALAFGAISAKIYDYRLGGAYGGETGYVRPKWRIAEDKEEEAKKKKKRS